MMGNMLEVYNIGHAKDREDRDKPAVRGVDRGIALLDGSDRRSDTAGPEMKKTKTKQGESI